MMNRDEKIIYVGTTIFILVIVISAYRYFTMV